MDASSSFALILLCTMGGAAAPEVTLTQASSALERECEDVTEENFFLCQSVKELTSETSCARALSILDGVGTQAAVTHAKTWSPSNFRVEVGGLPSKPATPPHPTAIGSKPFERAADIVYVLESAAHTVSLVSCDLSATPRLVDVQSSATSEHDSSSVGTCADALQERFDAGEEGVDAVGVRGWDPQKKEIIQGKAEPSSDRAGAPGSGPIRVAFLYKAS